MGETRKYVVKLATDFGTVGMTVSFCIFIGVAVGHYLDQSVWGGKYEPWPTLIGLGFGVAAAFKNLFVLATRKDWDDDGPKD